MLKKNKQTGFTLIEALVALSILSLAVVACLQVFSLGLKLAQSAKNKTKTIFENQALVEEELSKPYEQIQGQEVYPGLKKIEINNLKTYVAD
ncbi:MAG: type II secretion system protein [bacterium]